MASVVDPYNTLGTRRHTEMNRNPYAPPVAAVADPIAHTSARPRSVVVSVALATASLVIGVLRTVASPPPGSLLVAGVVLLLIAALVYAIWAQRGWARWIFLVLF